MASLKQLTTTIAVTNKTFAETEEWYQKMKDQLKLLDEMATKIGYYHATVESFVQRHSPVEGGYLLYQCSCGVTTNHGYVQHVVDELWT